MIIKSLELVEDLINQENYSQAIDSLEQLIEIDPENLNYYWYLGLVYLLQENEELAQEIWLSILLQGTLEQAEQWTNNLINFLEVKVKENIASRKLGNAKIIYENITVIQPEYKNVDLKNNLVEALSLFASDLSFNKEFEEAINIYLETLALDPNHYISWHALALNYYYVQDYHKAIDAINTAISLDKLIPENYHVLGMILEEYDDEHGAIKAYNQAIQIDPMFIDSYICLGDICVQNKKINEALNLYQTALKIASGSIKTPIFRKIASVHEFLNEKPFVHFNLGYAAYFNKENEKAIPHFEQFLRTHSDDIEIHLVLGYCYQLTNQPKLAISLIEKTLKIFPNDLALMRLDQSTMPIIYDNIEDIDFYRQRFLQRLEHLSNLVKENKMAISQDPQAIIKVLQTGTNYTLGFQGKNDLGINKKYANYIHSILKIIYPHWCQPIDIDSNINSRKIRIGYVSTRLHGLGKLYLGWLKYCDKSNFKLYTYDVSGYTQNIKNEKLKFREKFDFYSDCMRFMPYQIEKICPQILSDKLDILIFMEIGLDDIMRLLSCLRLAPIQCTTWGHPITSGSPTIDYFLSNDLMEPVNGDTHYSETLVRLPNLGFIMDRPILQSSGKTRSDFKLRKDAVVYLCCQSLLKYLPQHDYIFPSIAQGNSSAQFIFFDCFLGSSITKSFRKRINKAFSGFGLNAENFCVFSSNLSSGDYFMVHQLSDIFLDSFDWSGGITSRDAITCALPIVTCPGQLMRSRQSYGMLQMIGVTETIAATEAEYIEIAIRLGLDSEWRRSVQEKMKRSRHIIFDDRDCIVGLETFFKEAIHKKYEASTRLR